MSELVAADAENIRTYYSKCRKSAAHAKILSGSEWVNLGRPNKRRRKEEEKKKRKKLAESTHKGVS